MTVDIIQTKNMGRSNLLLASNSREIGIDD